MKKTFYTFTIAVSLGLLACGRPSTSNLFELDGVGDPNAPITGNPVPGKWGGSISLTNWQLFPPSYDSILTDQVAIDTFVLNQAYFNKKDIAGLGGWDVLIIGVPAPPRLGSFENAKCYMDSEANPLLGGNLESLDVGDDIDFEFGVDDFDIARDDDDEIANDDLLVWLTEDFQDPNTGDFLVLPYDEDVEMQWNGGTLGNKGFETAPPFPQQEVLHFPEDIVKMIGATSGAPTVNGARMSASLVPVDTEYEIEWDDTNEQQDLLGTEIILTVYGPSNLGDNVDFDYLPDNPFFNRLARMVCLVNDQQESFTIFQSTPDQGMVDIGAAAPFSVDELLDLAMSTGKYALSTEDANGNGQLDERDCGGIPPTPCREDGNLNGVIDKIYGIQLTVNRRAERKLEIDMGDHDSNILISGNALKATKLEFGSAPAP